ncbi:hypothetical protein [Bacteroides caecimuris]|uniref:hypothetical protein n=1 Tax=Bacteroides caecimuris TaxID=1796613 RepID=UPI0026E550A1|nr:hypothetical protein [Bacteroides caecimuris]
METNNYNIVDDDDFVTILDHRFWVWGVDRFSSKNTGLFRDVLICTCQPSKKPLVIVCKESCRKGQYFNERAQVFVTIEDNPCITVPEGSTLPDENWSQIVKWIRLNKEGLLQY